MTPETDTDSDLLPWILGALILSLAGIAFIVAGNSRASASVTHPLETRATVPSDATPVSSPVANRAAPPTLPRGQVWECAANGQKVFSNRPCGDQALIRQLQPINRMDPTPIPRAIPSTAAGAQSYSSNASYSASVDGGVEYCEELSEAIKSISERLRHPYTVPEGNYYRGRLREIADQQFERHCDR